MSPSDKGLIHPQIAIEFESDAQGWQYPPRVLQVSPRKTARRKVERWIETKRIDVGGAEAINWGEDLLQKMKSYNALNILNF